MSKVKFGLSNVYIALRKDSDGTITYEKPVAVPGAVNLSLTRNSNKNDFYADNITYFTSFAKTGFDADLEVADIAREIMTKVLGYVEATEGGVLETNAPTTPQFALLFQVETDVKARKFCIFNCTAAESDEEYKTIEDNIDPTTSKLTLSGAGEKVGDVQVYRQIVESTDANYDTFFTTVTVPTIG